MDLRLYLLFLHMLHKLRRVALEARHGGASRPEEGGPGECEGHRSRTHGCR